MIFGSTLPFVKERAKEAVRDYFVGIAEGDGTPPTLRAMYVLKAQQAELVLGGGTSEIISQEAALRGLTAMQMAQTIWDMSQDATRLEIARMTANVQIEAATTHGQVMAVLKDYGLGISVSVTPVDPNRALL